MNDVNTNETVVEKVDDVLEEKKSPVLNEEDPLNEVSEQQLRQLIRQVKDMVGILEAQWNSTKNEFKIKESHIKELYVYNSNNHTPMPEGLTTEEVDKWDKFNGLDSISEDKVLEIFGNDHPIIGIEHSITIDRIKSVVNDFYAWTSAVKEYQEINKAYLELIENKEAQEIERLEEYCKKEEDPEKKEKMQKSLDMYYSKKYLDFLAEPLDEKSIDRLVKMYSDEKKIKYLYERALEKLKQLKVSRQFINEIAQFEKRFLPEEYHKQYNIFLLYFMNMIVYANINDKSSNDRSNVYALIIGLDKFVRNLWDDESKERILSNMIEFQKQFLGKI